MRHIDPNQWCPLGFNIVGNSDLAFRTRTTATQNIDRLVLLGFEVTEGPLSRFGFGGWGRSVYCRDPSGNGIELISDPSPREPAPRRSATVTLDRDAFVTGVLGRTPEGTIEPDAAVLLDLGY